MKGFIKFILSLLLVIYLTSRLFIFFAFAFITLFPPDGGGWGGIAYLVTGIAPAYAFFLFLVFPLILPKMRWWFYIPLLIPVFWYVITVDPWHFYFPFVFGLISLGITKVIKWLLKDHKNQHLVKIFQGIVSVLLVSFLSFATYKHFGRAYNKLFDTDNLWISKEFITLTGMPSAYLFFLFLLTPFILKNSGKWFYIVLSIPAIVFQMSFDFSHLYFPVIFAVIGRGTSSLVRYIIQRNELQRLKMEASSGIYLD